MNEDIWSSFSERVTYDGRFHATCEFAPLPDSAALALLNDRNVSVLTAVAALVEKRAETPEDDTTVTNELSRLDAKLNVLMEIVNRLLLPQADLPPRIALRFNASGAVLPWDGLPAVGQPVLLRIHFDVCRALPLELPGQRLAGPSDGRGFIGFQGLSEHVRDAIERLVFRHHRRQVAEARLAGRPMEGG
ncbi:atypical PilZ domain-containing cyclic di-GMP receptor [Luteibacter rhizovicinus]|uniref:Atypical PilZ domain-containing cyclic di-GMP receptor n=1 Tax=Luteibacter rhizovicinus TaxID=242606 RepID=A0A4V2W449_9GAMM|nr:PilZ domain-containing protein [Luteibacter rhizovicinus]TCV94149.1 atypical PilZ domain-containing cyclic di-GMP receptor [Luteibacter rhizovicinus]